MQSVRSAVLGCLFGSVALSGWAASVAAPSVAAPAAAAPVKEDKCGWHGGAWLGAGYWGGDVTYSIGGHYKEFFNGIKVEDGTAWDPVSELKWPINIAMASVGGNFGYRDFFDVDVAIAANINDPSDKMEDSDWTDPLDTSLKTIYSESDADLQALRGDFDLKVWLFRVGPKEKACFSLGPIGGFMFQHFDWTAKNLDQWYPPYPYMPHERISGDVGTYKVDTKAPYVGLATKVTMGRLVFDADVALAYYWVSDQDDHLLRYKLSESDCDDWGWKADAQVRFYFVRNFYVQAILNAMGYEVTGVQKQRFYAGEEMPLSIEIDNKIKSTQISGLLALGCEF